MESVKIYEAPFLENIQEKDFSEMDNVLRKLWDSNPLTLEQVIENNKLILGNCDR